MGLRTANVVQNTRSDFIVYVDESGDHSLKTIDKSYPIFVLAFCVFYKDNYVNRVVPALEQLKFDKFGHDIVILHEREIRKETGVFGFRDKAEKEAFIGSLTNIIEDSNFILISCIIDKREIQGEQSAQNPYHIALRHCLDALADLLDEKGQQAGETHIVFECRGNKEDKELELEFRRICDNQNSRDRLPFHIVLADKKVNSAGLQLADLVARPIGMKYLKPQQENRAFEILKMKFLCEGGRANAGQGFEGWGLKIIPGPESERPR